ncbi:hypothetical protein IWW37_004515 [Coemansia sp. RSA 2050]|nr:hypothetical protein IWW37_004515 [Coemansia sp. RSA 2050]KAJ2732202.1 hypothetical protein IW152_003985 [Coemansia sp. BCRC 34962]
MDSRATLVDHGFVDGCYIKNDAYNGAATLVSFHLLRYALFTLMLLVVGPFVFRVVAAFFDLERDFKSIADHFDDVTGGLMYTYILFTLGNYSHTFGWVTASFYFVGLLAYSGLAWLPFMGVSIPGWRSWSKEAWLVNSAGLVLALIGAGFHIRWASQTGILQWYLPLFVLASASLWSPLFVKWLHHYCIDNYPEGLGIERRSRRAALSIFISRSGAIRRKYQVEEENQLAVLRMRAEQYAATRALPVTRQSGSSTDDNDNGRCGSLSTSIGDRPVATQRSSDVGTPMLYANNSHSASRLNMPNEPAAQPRATTLTHAQKQEMIERKLQHRYYLNARPDGSLPLHRYQLHLHHWQIFYTLAFFTRFDDFASRACAGIVLGIFTHGHAAFGLDPLMERKGELNP